MPSSISPPAKDEYATYYAGYIALVADSDLRATLARQPAVLRAACVDLSEEEATHRYAPGKWSIKEVIGHLTDAERIFSYRALRIGRGDATPLSSFDENRYVTAAGFDALPVAELLAGFDAVRASTLALLRQLPPHTWESRGEASGYPVSVRALLYITAGHAEHHLAILRERYRLGVPRVETAGG